MRKRTLVVAAVVAVSVIAPVSEALRIAPLKTRNAVVVNWRAQNKVAVVAQPNGNLLAIHSLRKVSPGTRVTVTGIKWGTPTSGIKWSSPAAGIKWGIKWGRNGSYQSGLRKKTIRKAVWTPVRGPIVKKIGKKAIVIGTPGGAVVIRIPADRAAGKVTKAVDNLPPVGATVFVRLYFGTNGVKTGRDLKYLKPPVPGASLPFAGTIVSIDPANRTMVVEDTQDPAYPVRITVQLPPEFSPALYAPGQEVAVSGTLAAGGTLALTSIGPNGDFTQADDPTAVQILTTGEPSCTAAIENACPPTSAAQGGTETSGAPVSGAGAPQPASSSTPPAPTPSQPGGAPPTGGSSSQPPAGNPPPGGTPPPGDNLPPGGGTPPPPPPPPAQCDHPRGDDDDDDAGRSAQRHAQCVRPCPVRSSKHAIHSGRCRSNHGARPRP